jgi:hypothetical protein
LLASGAVTMSASARTMAILRSLRSRVIMTVYLL